MKTIKKKLIPLLIAVLMIFCLTACNPTGNGTDCPDCKDDPCICAAETDTPTNTHSGTYILEKLVLNNGNEYVGFSDVNAFFESQGLGLLNFDKVIISADTLNYYLGDVFLITFYYILENSKILPCPDRESAIFPNSWLENGKVYWDIDIGHLVWTKNLNN